jgi:hypothetical protein
MEFYGHREQCENSLKIVGNVIRYIQLRFVFLKKGYAMVKVFGFMLALAAMVSSANAALLVSYQYVEPDVKDPTSVLTGLTAEGSTGAFNVNNGLEKIASSVNNTTTTRKEDFAFSTTAPNSITVNSMTFDTALITGTRAISFTPSFKLDGVDVASNLYSVTGSGFDTYTVTFIEPFVIGSGEFVASISAKGASNGTSTSFTLDNVNFNGDLVPEPASMAIFGLLGVGAAARRFRRKK